MFWDNIKRRLTAVTVQVGHAEERGISNVAKSAYYRSATILVCTVVEGLVYKLARIATKREELTVAEIEEYKRVHKIPRSVFGRDDVVICRTHLKKVHIDDGGVTFKRLNDLLRKKKVINDEVFKQLEYVRKERNKLHLQGLEFSDTGYTKNKLNKATEPLEFLLGSFE